SDLAPDLLVGVPDSLALVRLGLAQLANVGRDLTDTLLVDALDRELRRRLHREGHAVGRLERHRVAEAQVELQRRRPLRGYAVTHAHDLELLLEALRDAGHHVGDQGPGQTVQRLALPLVVGPLDLQAAVLGALDRDRLGDRVAELPLRPLHRHALSVDRD